MSRLYHFVRNTAYVFVIPDLTKSDHFDSIHPEVLQCRSAAVPQCRSVCRAHYPNPVRMMLFLVNSGFRAVPHAGLGPN